MVKEKLVNNQLYETIKELISIIGTLSGDFQIPIELLRHLFSLIGTFVETFVLGESNFEYKYRIPTNQIPGINV